MISNIDLQPWQLENYAPVDMGLDVVLPVDYFRPGVDYSPKGADHRSLFLEDMEARYANRQPSSPLVRVNYYRKAANFYAQLLTSYPPKMVGVDDEEFTMSVNRQLAMAAYHIGLDQTKFGTVVLRPMVVDSAPIIEIVDPRRFYPTEDPDTDILLSFGNDLGDGFTTITVQVVSPETIEVSTYKLERHILGELLNREVYPGFGVRGVFPEPSYPSDMGNFGTSMFVDMAPLIDELNRRYTKLSTILDRHSDPILVFKKYRQSGVGDPAGSSRGMHRAERLHLSEQRSHDVMALEGAYEEAGYLSWDAQLLSTMQHISNIEDTLFSTTGVLYSQDGNAVASGTSLKRVFFDAYTNIHTMQELIVPDLEFIVQLLAGSVGYSMDGISVEWGNPLDHIDTQAVLQTSDPADAEETVSAGDVTTETEVEE